MAKNLKIFEFGKITKYDDERQQFEKKTRFHPFKSHLYQNGKSKSMTMGAGRLVTYHLNLCVVLSFSFTIAIFGTIFSKVEDHDPKNICGFDGGYNCSIKKTIDYFQKLYKPNPAFQHLIFMKNG